MRSVGKRTQTASTRRRKSERKITRMVVVVVAVFIFCWLPFYALNIINLLVVLPGDFRGLYYFVVVLSYANSCANPILYGFLSDNFKRGFKKALCRTSRRVNNNDRAGTEIQRPTEEWGGIVLQPQRTEGLTNMQMKDCVENDEKEETIAAEGASQMGEMHRTSQKENHNGVKEGTKKQVMQRSNTELGSGFHADIVSSMVSRGSDANSQPEEFLYKNTVLDISYL